MSMETRSIETIVRALNEAGVRYLIAGGLAVVAHGYTRVTQDMDLILDLGEENVRQALSVLAGLGYRPTAPVAIEMFADPAIRAQWVREKGMTVFSLFSPAHPTVVVDLFAESPLDFASAYPAAPRMELFPNLPAAFIGYEDLLRLKRQAGRPKDLLDVDKLQALHGETTDG
jgi:hypothetical protein